MEHSEREAILMELVDAAYDGMAAHFPDSGMSDQDIMFFLYNLTHRVTRNNDHSYSLIANLASRIKELRAEGKLIGA